MKILFKPFLLSLGLIFLQSLFLFSNSFAQVNMHPESANILLALEQLPYKTSILYIAAHPDDENNRLLTYLVKGRHLRTGYLALTRGEGGQNLIGREQGETLGLVRTEELLAAREVDGAEQFFSRALDFGYSKNPEETLNFWNRDSILSDMVWVIRNFQPDIIMDRFPTTGEGGHGNHTASAILTLDAVKMAADEKAFPAQLQFVKTWNVKKVFWNTFNFGGLNTTAKDQLHFQVNSYNPLLGLSYGELAAKSRSNHKSQGFGTGSAKGEQYEYFKTLIGAPGKNDFMEGLDSTWQNQPGADSAFGNIQKAIKDFQAEKPETIIPYLVKAYKQIKSWPESPLQSQKLQAISHILLACSGIEVECTSLKGTLSYDDPLPLRIDIIKRRDIGVQISRFSFPGGKVKMNGINGADLGLNTLFHDSESISLDSTYSTQPYQLQYPHAAYRYVIKNPEWIGKPKKPNPLEVKIFFNIMGQEIHDHFPILVKYIDPVKGEYFEPVAVIPPISAEPDSKIYIFKNSGPKKIKVTLTGLKDSLTASVKIQFPKGWSSTPASIPITLYSQFSTKEVEFSLQPPKAMGTDSRVDSAKISSVLGGKTYSESLHTIKYDHIPWINYTEPSQIKLVRLALNTPARSVAYIMGAGDYVPEILGEIGYPVHLLSDAEIKDLDLRKYTTLIIGVRAFNTKAVLKFSHDILMNFVKNGGTLLVQYNTNSNLVTSQIGPYPFSLDRDRVTDENAEVKILDPNSSLLNYPNKIVPSDFKNWVQERGLYFPHPGPIDSPYKTLFSMHDPGEQDLTTSVLYTPYGKGMFVYTSLVFFRELPAGNPGAIRLFVNLINARHE